MSPADSSTLSSSRIGLKRAMRALTPPVLLNLSIKLLRRVGLLEPPPARKRLSERKLPKSQPPAVPEPPMFEFVPEGWAREVPGWDGGAVAQSYLKKWPEWVAALDGPGPLGIYHEVPDGVPLPRDNMDAHGTLMAFAYVLARAANGRGKMSVLDWGGGLAHYSVLARAVLPEVELEWHCREVPTVAAAGETVNPEVTFHSDDDCLTRTYDLVFASGSFQFAIQWQDLLRRFAEATRGFLYITRLPIASGPSFVVVQHAGPVGYATEYLGWVICRDELLAEAAAAGLILDREALLHASFAADGAPEQPTPHRGYLFQPNRAQMHG